MNERELALAVAAEAPAPDPDFVRQLDERVERGFPRDGRATRLTLARARMARVLRRRVPLAASVLRLRPPVAASALRRRPPVAAIGAVASVLVALVVAVSLIGGGDSTRTADVPGSSSADQRPGGAIELDSPADGAIADPAPAQPLAAARRRSEALNAGIAVGPAIVQPNPDAAVSDRDDGAQLVTPVPPAPRPGFAPGTRDRRIERAATMTLAAPDDRLDKVAADIATVTDRYRGFVLSSSLATGDEGATTGGSFELRIPAARLDAALADLGELGQVRSRTTAGRDVTAAFVTTGDRLEGARAERASLLTRLENADSDNAAAALRLQLDANAGEINRLKGRLGALRIRTNYANVAVTLQSTDADTSSPASDDDGLSAALDDAADSLSGALELLIRALGVVIPLALVVAAFAFAGRAIQRRRRESALR
jgi:hypothetical protein